MQRPATTKNIFGKMKQIGVVLIIACYRALAEKQTERLQSVHRGERSDSERDKKDHSRVNIVSNNFFVAALIAYDYTRINFTS